MHISAIVMMVNASCVLCFIVQGSLLLINWHGFVLCYLKFILKKLRDFGVQSKSLTLDAIN